ncbi:MAG: hypothetical protein IJ408_06465 [Clostridia bacterium]|nr:hypothetical protein [Clostridia bacterium]
MLYINQKKYPDIPYRTRTDLTGADYEKGLQTTVSSSGCGICSAVMVADRLLVNHDFDLEAALQLSYQSKSNHKSGTHYERYAPALAEKLGLNYEMTDDIDRLLYCLGTGGVGVALVAGDKDGYIGVFSHKIHYVVVIGVERDGRLAILDPAYLENKFDEEGRQGKVEMKNGVIALCDKKVLLDDLIEDEPSFYLFWRK